MIYQDRLDPVALEQYAAALNSRAGRAGARGRLSAEGLRDRILESGGRCEWCAVSLVEAEFELDHVLSLKQGGAHAAANLVVSCPDCNRRKGQKHPARFAAEIYRETGRYTGLVDRVLQHYAIEGARQKALFADETSEASAAADANPALKEAPPYRWAD